MEHLHFNIPRRLCIDRGSKIHLLNTAYSSSTKGKSTNEPLTLNLVFISREKAINDSKVQSPLGKSDHSLVNLFYQYEAEDVGKKFKFDLKGDYKKVQQLLNVNWKTYIVGYIGNIDLLWQTFHKKFKAAVK